ncbi:methylenetetrahydrofolate reductase [NAD(P)H] [Pseudokordiimonas caeni]|uniref:methylenetetrahydrofolate reductase [NAD(P)H] n=1 Tax=Pseudokordiimonas caeni TaxID=2997908 RepID=UPI00281208CA|nr:methylenetetrahydrofolate reductase [NAD(P)H] [Pseudokordiimonas caeni]
MTPPADSYGLGPRHRTSLFAESVKDVRISFEFFPPKTEAMERTLWESIKTLEPLDPAFVSVTYGAGGSTRERTHNTVKRILTDTALKPAAHLTCVNATREEVDAVIRDYKEAGVNHIVALRGDPPEGAKKYEAHPGGYANAAELVAGIRAIGDFEISVGAYPEKHPDSPTLAADLDNLKRKIDAGATRAITQFFFDAEQYFRFLDHCQSYGINVPIVPGILPVTNFKSLKGFAGACGASVPAWLGELFEGLDERPQTRALVAATVAGELCRRLYAGGVRDFHFYTLNRAELTFAVCHMLGHRAPAQQGVIA